MTKPRIFFILFVLMMSVLMWSAGAEDPQKKETRTVDAAQKTQAITELVKLIRAKYAMAEPAEKAALLLEQNLSTGSYDPISDARVLAETITNDIQAITGDKHFRLGLEPLPEPKSASIKSSTPAKPVDADAERAAWLAQMRRGNNGFLKLDILAGNVGYLDYRRFQPPDLSGDTLVGAMAFLANADAIIIDLRNCHGGSAYMTGYLAGYFFATATHLMDMEFRGNNYTDHFWTTAYLPGKRLADVPLYILTSAYTFSGAEGFAYRFKVLKRATIIGETTGGGANAGGMLKVAPFFRVFMPMGRPVDRDTGTNWEGTGVEPDIKTAAQEALVVAHLEALTLLKTKNTGNGDQTRLDWAIEKVTASRHPVNLSQEELQRFSGNYGTGRVFVEGNQLRFQPESRQPFLLTPLTSTVFMAEAQELMRLEFLPGPQGTIEKLILIDEDGTRGEFQRENTN